MDLWLLESLSMKPWMFWVLLLSHTDLAASQDLCGIFSQRTAIIQNTLYFFGGNYTFSDDPSRTHDTLFSINLEPRLDISGSITQDQLGQSDLPTTQLSNDKGGAVFYDSTGFYAYVSSAYQATSNNVWFYNESSTGNWSLMTVNGDSGIPDDLLAGQDTSTGTGMSYYLGGDFGPDSTNSALGLTIFNSSDPNSPTWHFNTGTANNRPPGIQGGELVYLPKGEAGILIAFGGLNTTITASTGWEARNLNEVAIYDIYSQTWYSQEATGANGSTPPFLIEFCAGVSAAPDDSSFQITMYGGIDYYNKNASNAIWILSIPSFEWIFAGATGTGEPDGENELFGRQNPKCDMLNDRQMLVSGGRVLDNRIKWAARNTDPAWTNMDCHPEFPPIKLLDTTDITWRTQIDSNNEYAVPGIVYKQIGGNGSGGATTTQPRNGWRDSRLKDIFSQTLPRESQQSPDNPSLPEPSTVNLGPSKPSIGPIVGGTLGGVAFLMLLCAVTYTVWRKKRSTNEDTKSTESGSITDTLGELHARSLPYEIDSNKLSEVHGHSQAAEIDGFSPQRRAELPAEYQ